jgi:PKD repeat protein
MRLKQILVVVLLISLNGFLFAQTFTTNLNSGCDTVKVKFSPDATALTADSLIWDFGFGNTRNSFNPDTLVYTEPGEYTVQMTVYDITTSVITKTITVYNTVRAYFDIEYNDTEYEYNFIPLDINHNLLGTYTYQWDIVDSSNSLVIESETLVLDNTNKDKTFLFPDSSLYIINLKISDNFGCSDSSFQIRRISPRSNKLVIGNVFSPEISPFFIIDPLNNTVILSFKVFTRTGIKVFDAESPIIYWDGKTNSGHDLPQGVYFYTLKSKTSDPKDRYTENNFIHLYR